MTKKWYTLKGVQPRRCYRCSLQAICVINATQQKLLSQFYNLIDAEKNEDAHKTIFDRVHSVAEFCRFYNGR